MSLDITHDAILSCKNNLYKFLKKRKVTDKHKQKTHSAFGDPWGSFYISDDDYGEFINLYTKLFLVDKSLLHIMEKQKEISPIIIDIDLSILGVDFNTFKKYDENIRKEYSWVPSIIYKRKRKKILQSFLNRNRIYFNNYFYDKYENQAKRNLNEILINY